MTDWILLNGMKVDRAAFEANYALANQQTWEKATLKADAPSPPCLICGSGVSGALTAYISPRGILCAPCYERFVGPSTPP